MQLLRTGGKAIAVLATTLLSLSGVVGPSALASQSRLTSMPGHGSRGRPGEHLQFRTRAPGISMPGRLRPGTRARPGILGDTATSLVPGSSLWRRGLLARGGALPRPPDSMMPAGSANGEWKVQPTPNVDHLRNGSLAAESCPSPASCTAVGSYENASGDTVPLVERWNGSTWRVLPAPAPAGATASAFSGVSCVSAQACAAVGYYNSAAGMQTLAEATSSTGWQIQATPALAGLGSGFAAVSCTSAQACTAVGAKNNSANVSLTLAERWNGVSWSVQATPVNPGSQGSALLGVWCSGATGCTAVGSTDNSSFTSFPLVLAWDGTSWAAQVVPSPAGSAGSGLSAISCATVTDCIAAGSYFTKSSDGISMAEGWNGAKWALHAVPQPAKASVSQLAAVACEPTGHCVATGSYRRVSGPVRAMAAAWNGSGWRLQRAAYPIGGISSALNAVSCPAANACRAVGSGLDAIGDLTLAEDWDGSSWTLESSRNLVGANPSELNADSCASAHVCMAVGYYERTSGIIDPLAEARHGSSWLILRTPSPRGQGELGGLSCTSAHACMAVGAQANSKGHPVRPMAEYWNGSKWVIQAVPSPVGSTNISLSSVSCASPRACVAVGSYELARKYKALAELWNGRSWKIQATSGNLGSAMFDAVSCPSASWCVAVGWLVNAPAPLVEAWNGAIWRRQRLPISGAGLDAVSCTSPRACMATGDSEFGPGRPLSERWNGVRWRAERTVLPPGWQNSVGDVYLNGVSCVPGSACDAVGGYTPDGAQQTFAGHWNGSSWRLEATYTPPGATQIILGGVSCLRRCTAVGSYLTAGGGVVTLAETAPS